MRRAVVRKPLPHKGCHSRYVGSGLAGAAEALSLCGRFPAVGRDHVGLDPSIGRGPPAAVARKYIYVVPGGGAHRQHTGTGALCGVDDAAGAGRVQRQHRRSPADQLDPVRLRTAPVRDHEVIRSGRPPYRLIGVVARPSILKSGTLQCDFFCSGEKSEQVQVCICSSPLAVPPQLQVSVDEGTAVPYFRPRKPQKLDGFSINVFGGVIERAAPEPCPPGLIPGGIHPHDARCNCPINGVQRADG